MSLSTIGRTILETSMVLEPPVMMSLRELHFGEIKSLCMKPVYQSLHQESPLLKIDEESISCLHLEDKVFFKEGNIVSD